ncbi:GNAT family N-acetyltransferase [Rhodoblastus sp.]|uniref:GNAT family N-acetyltransferase n=1 Tax=Rhodoblastus sp. TaxID=1962975 RepID=UPI003F99B572
MTQALITIRRALPGDAEQIAAVHDSAWREAYRGLIPGRELERLIARRGPDWWRRAVAQGSRLLVFSLHGTIGGYVTYGRNRAPSMHFDGEIFELYLSPEYQGMGFGARLFKAARHDLAANGLDSMLVWTLSDNDRALAFYRRMGGEQVRRASEHFGAEKLGRLAFGFPAAE